MRRVYALVSAVVVCCAGIDHANAWTTQNNTDRPGANIRNFEIPPRVNSIAGDGVAERCEAACKADSRCKSWTAVRPGLQSKNGMCWLKPAIHAAVPNNCCTSGANTPTTADASFCRNYALRQTARDKEYTSLKCTGWASGGTLSIAGEERTCLGYGANAPQTTKINESTFQSVIDACKKRAQPGPPTPTPGGDAVPAQWADMLAAHNEKRKLHCVGALTWSAKLAADAQEYAALCKLGQHSSTGDGENLNTAARVESGEDKLPAKTHRQSFQDWYSEINNYRDYNNPKLVLKGPGMNGHFTQVVWKDSRQLGCGMATCQMEMEMTYSDGRKVMEKHKGTQWVCRYSPAGNDARFLKDQVKPPTC
jgi:uncharacterized protein YkwD